MSKVRHFSNFSHRGKSGEVIDHRSAFGYRNFLLLEKLKKNLRDDLHLITLFLDTRMIIDLQKIMGHNHLTLTDLNSKAGKLSRLTVGIHHFVGQG